VKALFSREQHLLASAVKNIIELQGSIGADYNALSSKSYDERQGG